jgi:hypothetical protein
MRSRPKARRRFTVAIPFCSSLRVESAHTILRLAFIGREVCQRLLAFSYDRLSYSLAPWLDAYSERLGAHVEAIAIDT